MTRIRLERGNQVAVRECYFSTMKQASKDGTPNVETMTVYSRSPNEALDPQTNIEGRNSGRVKELIEIPDGECEDKTLKIEKNLSEVVR